VIYEAIHPNIFAVAFVVVDHPEEYGLLPGMKEGPDGQYQVYAVSMFHQLHCLVIMTQNMSMINTANDMLD
jgi:hypothetical protein